MAAPLVPTEFTVPTHFEGHGFRLEPLGPKHNDRDRAAWMSSIDHIHSTPGFEESEWPRPMGLEANLADLEPDRAGFTYSVLDADEVIGCLYIYQARTEGGDASARSWVTESRTTATVAE